MTATEWLETHYINGPSDRIYPIAANTVNVFLSGKGNLVVLATIGKVESVKHLKGQYYVVFRGELNNFLKTQQDAGIRWK